MYRHILAAALTAATLAMTQPVLAASLPELTSATEARQIVGSTTPVMFFLVDDNCKSCAEIEQHLAARADAYTQFRIVKAPASLLRYSSDKLPAIVVMDNSRNMITYKLYNFAADLDGVDRFLRQRAAHFDERTPLDAAWKTAKDALDAKMAPFAEQIAEINTRLSAAIAPIDREYKEANLAKVMAVSRADFDAADARVQELLSQFLKARVPFLAEIDELRKQHAPDEFAAFDETSKTLWAYDKAELDKGLAGTW